MNNQICTAIENNQVIEFHYDGHYRKVEPYCHGWTARNKETVRGYQIDGGSNSRRTPFWRLFTIQKMGGLTLTDEAFLGDRPLYNPDDDHLRVHCNI